MLLYIMYIIKKKAKETFNTAPHVKLSDKSATGQEVYFTHHACCC